jgi:hypothetical protein
VPRAEIVTVVSLFGVTSGCAEIADVAGCSVTVILVISGSGPGAIFEAGPGGSVAFGELFVTCGNTI